jgi:phage shock protein E
MRILALIAILVLVGCDALQSDVALAVPEISLEEFSRQTPGTSLILDVRTPKEYAAGHIPNALNIPHDALAERIGQIQNFAGAPVVVYCKSGTRAAQAAEVLSKAGFRNARHLTGDMDGWVAAGYPVKKDGP